MPEHLLHMSKDGFLDYFFDISNSLNELKDLDVILEHILSEAMVLSSADAGTIYLVEDDLLRFSYVRNDTLFKDSITKDTYSNITVPIDNSSIVGYVAEQGKTLHIQDAYNLPGDSPVQFNPSFDQRTGYRTVSMFTLPIKTSQGKVSGVMQLINAKDESGRPVEFSKASQKVLPVLANIVSIAIERAIMTRELILRMVQMAELRDPSETGAHVQRVGSYCAAIYHQYALMQGLSGKKITKGKDLIRVAAMLHDVGKIGVSDKILKKPGPLDEEETVAMRYHTIYGARLFLNSTSELDNLSTVIALRHHDKWDGTGYPGKLKDIRTIKTSKGEPLKGKEIPLEARICALADVFDALGSSRSYKEPWPEERILETIKKERGRHFDPDVVDAFFKIFDVIQAIARKYTESCPLNIEKNLKNKV